jgi:hypothetical protein
MNASKKSPMLKAATQQNDSDRRVGIDLKAAYTVLIKAYIRTHTKASVMSDRVKETNHE